MKQFNCRFCNEALESKNAVCPKCGKVLYTKSNIGIGVIGAEKQRIYPGYVVITEKRISISVSSYDYGIDKMFGVAGVIVGEAAKKMVGAEQENKSMLYSLGEIEQIITPIEKYGFALNTVKGDKGIQIHFKDGNKFVFRLPKSSDVAKLYHTLEQSMKQL